MTFSSWIRAKEPQAKYFCVSLFLFLCVLHFFSGRPLWQDEEFIYKSIVSCSYRGLFADLNDAQVFPRIHLVIIKFIGSFFGYSIYSLRFIAFISMILAFFLWLKIYRKVFPEAHLYILSLFALCGSYYMSYYSFELKAYSMDVLVAAWFLMLTQDDKISVREGLPLRDKLVVFILPFTLFFSYAAIFVVGIPVYNMALSLKQNKKVILPLFIYSLILVISLFILYHIDLKFGFKNKAINEYWASYFICHDSVGCFFETFWEGIRRLAASWFGKEKFFMRFASFLIPFFIYSYVKYGFLAFQKEGYRVKSIGSLYFVLILELFVFALLKKYPFTGERVTLFLCPFIFYGMIKALDDLKNIKALYYLFNTAFLVLLVISILVTLGRYISFF